MKINDSCNQKVNSPKIVFQENRSKLILLNPERKAFEKITVDGCQITQGIRCDYLLRNETSEYFIELKGQNISHAVDQLARTIKLLSQNLGLDTKTSFIICTRSPMTSTKIQVLQAKFRKNFNSTLIIKNSPFEYRI